MFTREMALNTARNYIGEKEGGTGHKVIISAYNAIKPLPRGYKIGVNDAWCAAFVSAVGQMNNANDVLLPECGCEKMIALYMEKGCWIENDGYTPKPGDLIFYHWKDSGKGDCTGYANHVGFVETVKDGLITTIEGNYDDCVKRRTLDLDGRYIRGYATPEYAEEQTPAPFDTKTVKNALDEINNIIDRLINVAYNLSNLK